MTTDHTAEIYCSALSREAGEPLYGSAPHNEIWFLLEYTQPWGARVLPESDLTDAVKARLSGLLKTMPKSNLLFIKQQTRKDAAIKFYVALPRESSPLLYGFDLERYEDLLDLPIEAAAAADSDCDHYLTQSELFLVCTNARRDRCCARYGLPLYRAMAEHADSRVWQCSHMGGHRFAPTSLFFPHGINYGRIAVNEAKTLIDDYRQGRIALDQLRGRVCYDGVAQAAEYFARAALELREISALRLRGAQETQREQWLVHFEAPEQGLTHTLHIQRQPLGVEIQTSCEASEQTPLLGFRLLSRTSTAQQP